MPANDLRKGFIAPQPGAAIVLRKGLLLSGFGRPDHVEGVADQFLGFAIALSAQTVRSLLLFWRKVSKGVDHVPPGSAWVHEMKYDGYRCLIAVGRGKARAYTHSGLDWSDKFAPIVEAAQQLKVRSALIDDEAVVLDAAGKSNFQALQVSLKIKDWCCIHTR